MNTAGRLGLYGVALAVVFAAALGAGSAVGQVGPAPGPTGHATARGETGPAHTTDSPQADTHATAEAEADGHAGEAKTDDHTDDQDGHGDGAHSGATDTPGGLQVSQSGYTFTRVATDDPGDFRFTIEGPDGKPVTAYDVEHDKKLHLIIASRDLTRFQHLHPEMADDGTWRAEPEFAEPGPYRAFADFKPTGGGKLTLGLDLEAPGDYRPKALPHADDEARVGDYTVRLAGKLEPGRSSRLTLRVSKDGEPVTDLQPYLGAYGHLVALRAGDLAYLHVHPDDTGKAGPEITFFAEVPSTGAYRLFLDFKHDGKVRTAAFTAETDPHGH
ncbi:hypothetical protein OUY22_16290 [Nonomuraea sp. MCN248]|uniref:DUF748 domain-containing protein n=1 Tax=Nonomuraea corallina TaxID=2989783 RepID=A0ABT4SCT2_9ACTN|nr:hypothetical protein [Nonomuraea corallina]MDA0634982.1 hypothetical protein [Nonomuraea corallina]